LIIIIDISFTETMKSFSSLTIVIVILAVIANVQGEYNKLEYTVFSSPGADIQSIELTPMPIYNPGQAFLSFAANLKRPIRKFVFQF
jgi:hypothetical protein